MAENAAKAICGVVMPISAIDDCNETHWADVLDIFTESIDLAGFEANLVSNADDVGIIHKRIIQNLYDNPVVVCDVSGKNPNVMFELGIRLAFDKPTIIVKDDKTTYSFDTSAIEHLEYPRDLRFSKIVEFKEKLASKIKATYERSTKDKNYTTFLKHFGEFTVAKLDKKEISGQEYIIEELKNLRVSMRKLERNNYVGGGEYYSSAKKGLRKAGEIDICLGHKSPEEISRYHFAAVEHPDLREVAVVEYSPGHSHLVASTSPDSKITKREIEKYIDSKVDKIRIPRIQTPKD